MSKHDHVLAGLVFSLQAAAMQQMGKIQDPATGDVAVNLDQARASIDVLEMLKAKCRTETPDDLLSLLDGAVMDLQLNFMDEVKKGPQAESENKEEPTEGSTEEPTEESTEEPSPSESDTNSSENKA